MKIVASIFKTFFLSLCIIANIHLAFAQTASILPQGKTQFLDNNGKPLTSGTVDFYTGNVSSTTRKTTWQNSGETIANTNPVVLDAGGRAIVYGDGSYRQVVKDRLGNLIWDQLTSSAGSGGSSGATVGDGNKPGVIIPWAGLTAPPNYAFSYGQEISRITYTILLANITLTQNVICTSGSPTLTTVSDTSQLNIGAAVEASCIPVSSVIVSKTVNSVTVNQNALISTTLAARFFPWGGGNGSTTFNVPDLRGVVLPGRNNMGGATSSNLTTSFYIDPNALNGSGGNQSKTLLAINLPPYTPSGTVTAVSVNSTVNGVPFNGVALPVQSGTGTIAATTSNYASPLVSTGTGTFTGVAQGGTSTAFATIQPSKTVNYIIKLLPDINLSVARCSDLLDAGTACTANTGTSGNTVPFLDGQNVFSGTANTFTNGVTVSGSPASLLGNSGSTSSPAVDITIQSLPLKASPNASNDFLLLWDSVSAAFRKVTPGSIGSVGTSGVTNIQGQVGAFTCSGNVLCASNNISLSVGTLGTIATQNANAVAITGGTITGMPTPTASTDVTTKSYVDGLINGGIITCTGANATSAIAASLSANPTTILKGSTCITTGTSIPANRTLQVAFGTTLQAQAGITVPVVQTSGNNVQILGPGIIDGNNLTNANANTVQNNGFDDFTIRGVNIINSGQTAIQLLDGSRTTIDRNKINNIGVGAIIGYYFGTTNATQPTDWVITDNFIDKRSGANDPTGVFGAILLYGGTGTGASTRTLSNLIISSNTIYGKFSGTGNGIEPLSASVALPNYLNVSIKDNVIDGTGLAITGPNSAIGVSITGNVIRNFYSICIEWAAFVGTLANNTCVALAGATTAGILIDGSTASPTTDTVISGNSIFGTTGAGIQTSGTLGSARFTIANNYVQVASGRGFFNQATGTAVAIITGNHFDGATTGTNAMELGTSTSPWLITNNMIERWSTANIVGATASDKVCMNFFLTGSSVTQNCP